jgi:hypothetical protein
VDKPFDKPVTLCLGPPGEYAVVASTSQAVECLLQQWPERHGPRHRDALDTCYKVLDGHRSTIDARQALVEAADEAGVLVVID